MENLILSEISISRRYQVTHPDRRITKVKNARFLRAGLNAKHSNGHASMSLGVLLHFNAA